MDTTILEKLHKSSVHNKVEYLMTPKSYNQSYLYDTKDIEAIESTSVYID